MRVLLAARHGAVVARTKAIGQLKALIVNAPRRCASNCAAAPPTSNSTAAPGCAPCPATASSTAPPSRAIRATARRALFLEAEAAEHETELEQLVMAACPELLDLPGVGVITAAQFLICWSHPGRIRSEAAFAALAGVAPIPASSGNTVRHRLNRSGDRQLNRALHTVALSGCNTTRRPRPTPPAEPPKARPPARSNDASNEPSPARSTDTSRPTLKPPNSCKHGRLTDIEASWPPASGSRAAQPATGSCSRPPPNGSPGSPTPTAPAGFPKS